MKKNYVIDTNILLSSPNAIFGFADNNVFITATTLQELDKKKTSPGEVGFNARKVNHILDELCMHSKELKTTGVIPLNHEGGTLAFLTGYNETLLPKEYSCEVADNRIIAACKQLSTSTPDVFLVTNDVSMRTNAMICGVAVQEYKNDHIIDSELATYKGYRVVEVNASLMKKAANITTTTINPVDYGITEPLVENEFVLITNKTRESKAYFIHKNGLLEKIPEGQMRAFGVKPMNDLQAFALYALTAPVEKIPLVIISGPAGCVDADTEFFNGKKWKRIADWNKTDKVLQFDTDTETASLVTPNAYIKLPCDKMYHIKTKYGIDQVLSPEHRVIYYNRASHHPGYNGPYEISAEEMIKKMEEESFYGKFKTTFSYEGAGIDLSDEEIELMCAVICDGTFNKNNPASQRCTLNLKRPRKIEQARELLNRMGIEYRETDMGTGYIRFMFNAPRREKEFSDYWYNCNKHQFQIICENILKWDGTERNNRKAFSQANKQTIDFLQFAFATCGYRTSIKLARKKGEIRLQNGKSYERKNDLYILHITKRDYVGISTGKARAYRNTIAEEIKPADGYKYCFNVPTHTLILRRNGNIFITGNCSKTFLSLAAGLDQTYDSKFEQKYNKVLISRNNVCADADFGYLPGDMEDKMMPLLAPFYDNLETLLSINVHTDNKVGLQTEIQMQIEDMFEDKIIDICPLAYMRGRSITNSYLIVDEVQNATKSQIRDIITRAGNGTKVILCGDPSQIDNHLLDKINNGLVYAADKMKGSPLCAQITFDEGSSVRSPLVREAIVRLDL